ncbi:unnamed protein product, partial [Vitis vinifera]|uniref:Uncharacterized protein n=1 Tax=Vitis vinifera TaxID=29760 RepID=D7UEE9_VITVI
MSSVPLLVSTFLSRDMISFSKPTTGIRKKLLNLVSLSKRFSEGSTSLMEQLLDFILEVSDSPKLATMSLHKEIASKLCGNSSKEPSFNIILSRRLPSPKAPPGSSSFNRAILCHPRPSTTSWFPNSII